MFIGTCFNEFPLSTSEDMTQTFNGEVVEYDISIDQQVLKDLLIKQKKSHSVYIKMEELFTTDKTSKLEK
jgi:hypothetical protein